MRYINCLGFGLRASEFRLRAFAPCFMLYDGRRREKGEGRREKEPILMQERKGHKSDSVHRCTIHRELYDRSEASRL